MSDLNYIYKNELYKACFAHDAAYSDSKDLGKGAVSDNILKNGANEIPINPKCEEHQMVNKFFDKKTWLEANENEVLATESHKPVI